MYKRLALLQGVCSLGQLLLQLLQAGLLQLPSSLCLRRCSGNLQRHSWPLPTLCTADFQTMYAS